MCIIVRKMHGVGCTCWFPTPYRLYLGAASSLCRPGPGADEAAGTRSSVTRSLAEHHMVQATGIPQKYLLP
jgi:hypothetical protein